jgi:hypothetical protein
MLTRKLLLRRARFGWLEERDFSQSWVRKGRSQGSQAAQGQDDRSQQRVGAFQHSDQGACQAGIWLDFQSEGQVSAEVFIDPQCASQQDQ